MDVIDLREIAKIGSERNILTIIDNTFATPINQNPLELGFDIVIHSGTKYLNGHSDVCCGAVVCSQDLMEKISETARDYGGVLDAHACYLLERGLKTLGLRVEQHNKNALRLAEFLNQHPKVKIVYYPGLPEHPGHEIAKSQMCGFGGMLSFELDCSEDKALEFVNKLELIVPAVSLGGIETILCFPAKTSHTELSAEERIKQRITDSLIRLSVGIEDVEDLITDLENALSAIS
jgi:cystathionine beta-lyase